MDAKSAEEFIRVFSKSQHRILRFVHTLIPNLADAEDVLQETSVVLWKKWPTFQRDKDFVKWACGIARLEVFQMFRQKKQNVLYLSESVLNQVADIAIAAIDNDWRSEASGDALDRCFAELLDSHQRVLRLRYHDGKTVQQIADECERPKSSIHDLLRKLRSTLLKCVQRRLGT